MYCRLFGELTFPLYWVFNIPIFIRNRSEFIIRSYDNPLNFLFPPYVQMKEPTSHSTRIFSVS